MSKTKKTKYHFQHKGFALSELGGFYAYDDNGNPVIFDETTYAVSHKQAKSYIAHKIWLRYGKMSYPVLLDENLHLIP